MTLEQHSKSMDKLSIPPIFMVQPGKKIMILQAFNGH